MYGKGIIQWQNGVQDGSLAFKFSQENGNQRGIPAKRSSLAEDRPECVPLFAAFTVYVPELNMRFTTVLSFLVAITATYASAIEICQGCRGTKVCPTNTVLQCCKGINGPIDACLPRGQSAERYAVGDSKIDEHGG
ncbi:hypothetical protein B0H13DRAFT_1852973 [Mycena leptocephala]|nr:hypothetical protein B0H13DRAFT_1852973 [Mycena leptocephala]